MSRIVATLCVIATSLLALPRQSHACCEGPPRQVIPASGSVLPANPTIFLFLDWLSSESFGVRVNGNDVPFTLGLVSVPPEWATVHHASQVYRLDIESSEAGLVELLSEGNPLSLDSFGGPAIHFRIDASWKPPPHEPPQVLSWRADERKGSTTPTDSFFVKMRPAAPIVRLSWAESQSAFDSGPRQIAYLPRTWRAPPAHLARLLDQFEVSQEDLDFHLGDEFMLGYRECLGSGVPIENLYHGIVANLEALYPDGSEEGIGPIRIAVDGVSESAATRRWRTTRSGVGAVPEGVGSRARPRGISTTTLLLLMLAASWLGTRLAMRLRNRRRQGRPA